MSNKNEILFLTEAGKNTGLGHLSRCTALADGFSYAGYKCKIITRGLLHEDNMYFNNYATRSADWHNFDFISKASKKHDIIIIDSYLASKKLLKFIADKAQLPAFLTDSQLNYYPKGIIIFPSIYAINFFKENEKSVLFIGGKDYLLFNQFMWSLPNYKTKMKVKKIGISLGSYADTKLINQTSYAVKTAFPNSEIYIFGSIDHTNTNLPPQSYIRGLKNKIEYINEMFKIDIMIVNGGQSLNEALLVGVPTIAVIVAANQNNNAISWYKMGLCYYTSSKDPNFYYNFIKTLKLYDSYYLRFHFSQKAKENVNAKGAIDIARSVLDVQRRKDYEKY